MAFEPESEVVELESRLGRVGSIQAFDLWQGRESLEKCYEQVSTIAAKSYAKEGVSNPASLFRALVNAKPVPHGEPLECIPVFPQDGQTIRPASLRHHMSLLENPEAWGPLLAEAGRRSFPAHAFKIEMPEMVYIHLLRHGATFGKNVVSRRKVTDEMLPVTFYGEEWAKENDPERLHLWAAQRAEYQRRRSRGELPELARTAFGNDQMIHFWHWGFARDYLPGSGLHLQRVEDPKAQVEIRVFVDWIANYLSRKPKETIQ